MKLIPVLEHSAVAGSLLLAASLGTQVVAPLFDGTFILGLFVLYSLGRTHSGKRWTYGPPLLRLCCWTAYAILICHWSTAFTVALDIVYLPGAAVLVGLLFSTTHWSLNRCFQAGRRHVTDGREDAARDRSLTTMIQAVGFVRVAGLAILAWTGFGVWQVAHGLPVWGQDLVMLALLCALGLGEAVTTLAFGERICSCCASAPANSSIILVRMIALSMVGVGWLGWAEPSLLIFNVGTALFALAVFSSGSPATLPIQLRARVEPGILGVDLGKYVPPGRNFGEEIDQLKAQWEALTTETVQTEPEQQARRTQCPKERIDTRVDAMSVELGRDLVFLASPRVGAKLGERIGSIRRHVAMELGLKLPGIRMRDNLQLKSDNYVVKIRDIEVAKGHVKPGHFLAIGPEEKLKRLVGDRVVDPTYGMSGVWVESSQRSDAECYGCMIFDPISVIATQLTEVARSHASRLLGLGDVVNLLDDLSNPVLVAAVFPEKMTLVQFRDLLRELLDERVSIRDLELILETLLSSKGRMKNLEAVREALRYQICQKYQNHEGTLNVLTVDLQIEKVIESAIDLTPDGLYLTIDPCLSAEILQAISEQVESLEERGLQAILLTSPTVRQALRKLTERSFPNAVIVSWNEIPEKMNVNSVAMVELDSSLE